MRRRAFCQSSAPGHWGERSMMLFADDGRDTHIGDICFRSAEKGPDMSCLGERTSAFPAAMFRGR